MLFSGRGLAWGSARASTPTGEIMKFDLSPNLLVTAASALGVAGIACLVLGMRILGLVLLSPLFMGGLVLMLIVIPWLIVQNRKKWR